MLTNQGVRINNSIYLQISMDIVDMKTSQVLAHKELPEESFCVQVDTFLTTQDNLVIFQNKNKTKEIDELVIWDFYKNQEPSSQDEK